MSFLNVCLQQVHLYVCICMGMVYVKRIFLLMTVLWPLDIVTLAHLVGGPRDAVATTQHTCL